MTLVIIFLFLFALEIAEALKHIKYQFLRVRARGNREMLTEKVPQFSSFCFFKKGLREFYKL